MFFVFLKLGITSEYMQLHVFFILGIAVVPIDRDKNGTFAPTKTKNPCSLTTGVSIFSSLHHAAGLDKRTFPTSLYCLLSAPNADFT